MQHRNAPFGEPTSSLALADKEGAEPKPDARDREIWACLSRNHAFRHRAPSAAFEFEGEHWVSWVVRGDGRPDGDFNAGGLAAAECVT